MNIFTKYIAVVLLLLSWPAMAAEEKANLFTLSYAQAEEAVSSALADKGASQKVAALINGRSSDAMYSYTKPLIVETRGLQFDNATGRWSASLLISSEGQVVTAMPASGRYDVLNEIAVLKHSVQRGQIIEANDIEIHDIAASQMRSDTVTDMSTLIGKSPAYSITAGRPIREHEVALPAMVKKSAMVQMHYRSPGMEITTSGQALEDGAKGAIINVKNLASNKTVQATVDNATSVSVTSPAEKETEASAKPTIGDVYATN
jgi:flagella basal body P-ring formation protein FlgA